MEKGKRHFENRSRKNIPTLQMKRISFSKRQIENKGLGKQGLVTIKCKFAVLCKERQGQISQLRMSTNK